MIKITLKDGSIIEAQGLVSPMDVAKSISSSLAKSTIAAKVDGKLVPLTKQFDIDFSLELITDASSEEAFFAVNKTASVILGKLLLAEGLATNIVTEKAFDDGFEVVFGVKENISESDLQTIQNKLSNALEQGEESDKLPTLPKRVKFVSLRGVSGAEEGNRIFGFAAASQEEFDRIVADFQDREERDHRRIGKEMELFFFDQQAARGLPF